MAIDFGSTAGGLHQRVVQLLEGEQRGLLLDAPSGEGELSQLLKEQGYHVIAGDIDENVVRAEVEFRRIDLNARLPFNDHELDYVINVEGLEHLENPHHTIKEFNRILKPGGKLILTTPNVLSIFSRLRYFLIGYHDHFGDYYANEENFYVLHINPVGLPEIDFALRKNDLEIEEITMNQDVRNIRGVLMKLLLNVCVFFVRMTTKRKVQDQRMKNYLLSKPMLFGEILIIKCKKKGEAHA